MATRAQKTKVGIFLLGSLVLLAVSLWVLSGYYDETGTSHWMEFDESIQGLYEGAIVQYLGVPVGKVRAIKVLPTTSRPYVEITLDSSKVTLYNGVSGQLVLYSIAAGTMSISLEGGDPAAGELPNNSKIPVARSAITEISATMMDMMDEITGIIESVKVGMEGMEEGSLTAMVDKVNTILDDTKGFLDSTRSTVDEANDTLVSLRGKIEDALDNVNKTFDEVGPVIDNLDELLVTSNEKLKDFDTEATSQNVDKILKNIADLSEKLNASAEQLDDLTSSALHEADNVEYSLRRALGDMSDALSTMRVFVEQVSNDPASLLRGKRSVEE